MEKADLLPLLVLDLDKTSISRTIDIIRTYLERLRLEDCVVGGKKIMFRGDFLTTRNVTRTIYQDQIELCPIDRFKFIEPIAGFFHLQMNVLKLFFSATWGKLGDRISLAHFQKALRQKGTAKNAKDFYACNNFFRTVVAVFVVALCMHGASCDRLPAFCAWLSKNNWRKLITNMTYKHIDPFKPSTLCTRARKKAKQTVVQAVNAEKAA